MAEPTPYSICHNSSPSNVSTTPQSNITPPTSCILLPSLIFRLPPHPPPLYPGTLYFSDVSSTSVFMLSPILCSFSSPYLETPFCFPNRYPRMPSTPPSLAKPSPLPPARLETLLLLFSRSPTAVNPLHHLSAHLPSTPKSKIPLIPYNPSL